MIYFFKSKVLKLVNPKKTDRELKENPLELEKGDVPAMILAAFLVLGPVFLIIIGMIFLLYWFL